MVPMLQIMQFFVELTSQTIYYRYLEKYIDWESVQIRGGENERGNLASAQRVNAVVLGSDLSEPHKGQHTL